MPSIPEQPPTCSRCKGQAILCKPLFRCTGKKSEGRDCGRYYHAACHLPHPKSSINWKCRRCANKPDTASRRYNEKPASGASSQPFASSMSSSSRPASGGAPASTAARPETIVIDLTGAVTEPAGLIKCSMPVCSALTRPGLFFCPDHAATIPGPAQFNTAAPLASPPTQLARFAAPTMKKKRLPDHLTARKSITQTSSTFRPASSSPTRGATLPTSSPTQGKPQAFSLQASPVSMRGGEEPPRKRPRLSPELDTSPARRQDPMPMYPLPAEQPTYDNPAMFPATEASHSAAEALPHGNKPSEPYKLPYETRPVFKLAGKKPPARRKMAAAPGISRTFEAPTVDEQLVLQFEDQMKSAPNPAASDRQGDEAESPVSRSSGFSEGERSRRRILRIHSKARLRKIEAASRTYELSMFPEQTSPVFGNASVNYPAAQWIPEELNAGLFRQSPSAFPRVIEQPSQAPALEVPIRPRPAGPRLEEEGVKTSRARSLIQIERPDTAPREIKQDVFDRLLYAQEGAATPPPGIVLPSPAGSADANPTRPLPADEPYYADIDPRIHWPQRHSEAWYAAKLEEIKARGGRKAWLGKAPLRLRQQLLAESTPFEETLPDKIRDNPAWLRMLKRLNGVEEDAVVPPAEKPMATRGRKPGPKKQQQQQVHVNGNGNGYGNGHGSGYGMFRG